MMDYWKYIGAGAVTLGAVTTATAYWLNSGGVPIKPIVDLNNQSLVLPGPERIHMSHLCKDGKLLEYIYEDAQTLYAAFRRGARVSNNGPALGWRPTDTGPYQWITFNQALERAQHFGSGLIELGLTPDNGTYVGIYSQNRPEYAIIEQGCYMYSMAIIPLYDTLGPNSVSYIINQAELSIVVCDKPAKVLKLLAQHHEHKEHLRTIILIDDRDSADVRAKAEECGVTLLTFLDVEEKGKANKKQINPCKPDDVATICYTSGTTGLPKGVILTHKGIISTSASCTLQVRDMNISPSDTIISYLPLAHGYERLCEVYIYMHGAKVGFFHGDVKKLTDDMMVLKPTMMPSVPRLLNRVYDKVMNTVNASPVKKALFNVAVGEKKKQLQRGVFGVRTIWDRIAFKKVQEAMGQNLKLMPCGSAPLSEKVLEFTRVTTNCFVVEGYGQTETSAICTVQVAGDLSCGQVGPPLPCNMIKLVDVPEMNYAAADDMGEVCVKGVNVFKGYLKDPEKTAEVMDADGWLHTGDIGCWMPNGSLKIIDRKKNLFKLAQGEYIAPEKIENSYVQSKLVAQIYVHGHSLEHCLVGVVVPDPDVLPKWAETNLSIKEGMDQLILRKEIKAAILRDLTAVGKDSGLHSFEQVKAIHLTNETFSIQNNLLTPTFKSKRRELSMHFHKEISQMYTSLKE